VTQEWIDRLAEGAVDDLVLRSAESAYWQLRLDLVLRNQRMAHELETLRDAAMRNAQTRPPDRRLQSRNPARHAVSRDRPRAAQPERNVPGALRYRRLRPLELAARRGCLRRVALPGGQPHRALLRSYDVLGRPGMDEFLIALARCAAPLNAMSLAERLRADVFSTPFHVSGEAIRLSACFGIANSHGRSPVVVLREAEKALEWAKAAGPESIQCFGCTPEPAPSPVTFLSASSGDELLAW
jgi:two-component system, cell cycle response regulator